MGIRSGGRGVQTCDWMKSIQELMLKLYACPITNSVLNSPCFAWHPYGKLELFKTELVIGNNRRGSQEKWSSKTSVGKVVAMLHRWLIEYEKNSGGTY